MNDRRQMISLGLTHLLESERGIIGDSRVGLIANSASVDEEGTPSVSRLLSAGIRVTCIFSPEHGYSATAEPGREIADAVDARTGLPVRSLYNKTREPSPDMLSDVDAIVFDLQDVGVRCYTYIWTMALAMKAAALYGKLFVVLDRPNPIAGLAVQGPLLDTRFQGFLGMYPIPLRHAMTVGELALMFNETFEIGADLAVVRMKEWRRRLWFADTGLTWMPPSPAIRSPECALAYAGTCLFEGTNISEGRGTSSPFRLIGAPWLDPDVAGSVDEQWLEGVALSPQKFRPDWSKYAGTECVGIFIDVVDKEAVDPVALSVALLSAIASRHSGQLEWNEAHFDAVAGTDVVRRGIIGGETDTIIESWEESHRQFEKLRTKYLLYVG